MDKSTQKKSLRTKKKSLRQKRKQSFTKEKLTNPISQDIGLVPLTNIKTFDQDKLLNKEKREHAKIQKLLQKSKIYREKRKSADDLTPGAIYLGHIPEGFTAKGMREYFSQFGDIGRIRHALSEKTGKSKGYAFVEFKCDKVAEIVAETMNNYLMFDKLLKCTYIPQEKLASKMFRGYRARFPLAHCKEVKKYNEPKDLQRHQVLIRRKLNNIGRKEKKLAELGIDFKFSMDDSKEVQNLIQFKQQVKMTKASKKEKVARAKKISISETSKEKEDESDSDNGNILFSTINDDSLEMASNTSDDSSQEEEQESLSFRNVFSINDGSDASKHTMELDSTDDEISFNTPPNARKMYKIENQSNKTNSVTSTSKMGNFEKNRKNVSMHKTNKKCNSGSKSASFNVVSLKKRGKQAKRSL